MRHHEHALYTKMLHACCESIVIFDEQAGEFAAVSVWNLVWLNPKKKNTRVPESQWSSMAGELLDRSAVFRGTQIQLLVSTKTVSVGMTRLYIIEGIWDGLAWTITKLDFLGQEGWPKNVTNPYNISKQGVQQADWFHSISSSPGWLILAGLKNWVPTLYMDLIITTSRPITGGGAQGPN